MNEFSADINHPKENTVSSVRHHTVPVVIANMVLNRYHMRNSTQDTPHTLSLVFYSTKQMGYPFIDDCTSDTHRVKDAATVLFVRQE